MCAREEGPHTSSTMTMMMWEGGRVCEGQRGSKRMSATSQQPRSPSIAACLLARGEREMYCWSASIKDYSRKVMNRRDGWPDR